MSSYARAYDFSIPAGGTIFMEVPGDYYKIITSTGNIATRRDGSNVLQPVFAGRGEKGATFQRLALTDLSGSVNTGQILIASGAEMVDSTFQAVGALAVRPEGPTGNYKNNAITVANTAEQLFTAVTNVNGAILLSASCSIYGGANAPTASFLAKATAPANTMDGDPVFICGTTISTAGNNCFAAGQLTILQYIPPGLGLFFITDVVTTSVSGGSMRSARWKML